MSGKPKVKTSRQAPPAILRPMFRPFGLPGQCPGQRDTLPLPS